jgi:hypothetical protein
VVVDGLVVVVVDTGAVVVVDGTDVVVVDGLVVVVVDGLEVVVVPGFAELVTAPCPAQAIVSFTSFQPSAVSDVAAVSFRNRLARRAGAIPRYIT